MYVREKTCEFPSRQLRHNRRELQDNRLRLLLQHCAEAQIYLQLKFSDTLIKKKIKNQIKYYLEYCPAWGVWPKLSSINSFTAFMWMEMQLYSVFRIRLEIFKCHTSVNVFLKRENAT